MDLCSQKLESIVEKNIKQNLKQNDANEMEIVSKWKKRSQLFLAKNRKRPNIRCTN